MSMITKAAGLDGLISAARKEDWPVVLREVEKLIRKYVGGSVADVFRLAVTLSGKAGDE